MNLTLKSTLFPYRGACPRRDRGATHHRFPKIL